MKRAAIALTAAMLACTALASMARADGNKGHWWALISLGPLSETSYLNMMEVFRDKPACEFRAMQRRGEAKARKDLLDFEARCVLFKFRAGDRA